MVGKNSFKMFNTDIFKENLKLTINELLNSNEENFELFKFFFNRVLELCEREAGKKNIEEYSDGLKCFTLEEVETFMLSQEKFSAVESQLNISSFTFKWSLAVLHAAYKYCFYQNPMFTVMGLEKNYDIQHILTALFALEDITSHHHTKIVHERFLNKYIESEKTKKSEQAKQAARIKHAISKENDAKNLIYVKKIWDESNWKSYTDCADYIFKEQLIDCSSHRKICALVSKAAKSK